MLECAFLTGLFFQFLTVLTGGAAFSSPFWVSHVTDDCHFGILVMCSNGSCLWSYMQHWEYPQAEISGWLHYCRLVYAGGLVFTLMGIVCAALRACFCRSSVRAACLVTILAALAFYGIGVPTGIFGSRTHRDSGVTFSGGRWRFEWGYFLSLIATTCSLIAPLLQLYSEYKHTDSDVVESKIILVNDTDEEDL